MARDVYLLNDGTSKFLLNDGVSTLDRWNTTLDANTNASFALTGQDAVLSPTYNVDWKSTGTHDSSAPSPIFIGYPSLAAGDLLVLAVVSKYPSNSPATPSGWTLLVHQTGGHGSAGDQSGNITLSVFYRIADGTESGSLTISSFGDNVAGGNIYCYKKRLADFVWTVKSVAASNNTPSTSWSSTSGSDPGIKTSNLVLVFTGMNSAEHATDWTFDTEAVSCSGVTFGAMTEREDFPVPRSPEVALILSEHRVATGPSSGNITFTATSSGSTADSPAGANVFVVLDAAFPILTADFGAFTESGQDANLLWKHVLDANTNASFALTGQDAGLFHGYYVDANTNASFAFTGQTTNFAVAHSIDANTNASFTLTGQDANFIWVHILDANTNASYTLTGEDANLNVGLTFDVTTNASFTLTGQDATLTHVYNLTADFGAFTETGEDASFLYAHILTAANGVFTLTGEDASLTNVQNFTLDATANGVFTLTLQDANLLYRTLLADATPFDLLGQNVHLTHLTSVGTEVATNYRGQFMPPWSGQ